LQSLEPLDDSNGNGDLPQPAEELFPPTSKLLRAVFVDAHTSLQIKESPILDDRIIKCIRLLPPQSVHYNLPKNTSHNYTFAVFRYNIHIMAQLLYIAGQVVPNVEATPMGGCLLRHPNTGYYRRPFKWKIESCRAILQLM
jgi:hypothetical protein